MKEPRPVRFQVDKTQILQRELKELVRSSVEETLNNPFWNRKRRNC